MVTKETKGSEKGSAASALLIAAMALAATVGLVVSVQAGPTGGLDLVETPAAIARTLAGDCASTPPTPVCKEVCFLTKDGHIIPQGEFVCTPP